MKKLIYFLFTIIFFLCFLGFSIKLVKAVNMSSDNYEIQMGNFNMASGSKSSTNYSMLDTIGQIAPGEYSEAGFIVKAGFIYIKTLIPFSFSISDLSIDFGSLIADVPTTQTNTLTVSSGGGSGYQVTAYEDNPLQIPGTATQIPDTICNGGAETCDETAADVWTNISAYGFGFNMSGNDIPADFTDSTYFRQFADDSGAESPQIVMSSVNVGRNRQSTVTYKVNVSGIQTAGNYENAITFICTPGY
ncbi:hypothetical protein ACFLZ1_03835 [Patescibacteria group bacterium]